MAAPLVLGLGSRCTHGRAAFQPVPRLQHRGFFFGGDTVDLEAIETFVQTRPLLAGGISRGLKLIVNLDEFLAPDQTESVADYKIRQNKAHP